MKDLSPSRLRSRAGSLTSKPTAPEASLSSTMSQILTSVRSSESASSSQSDSDTPPLTPDSSRTKSVAHSVSQASLEPASDMLEGLAAIHSPSCKHARMLASQWPPETPLQSSLVILYVMGVTATEALYRIIAALWLTHDISQARASSLGALGLSGEGNAVNTLVLSRRYVYMSMSVVSVYIDIAERRVSLLS
ncbi:hypothetical protein BC835DRAFT_1306986 [Cytidiella melzeri]|nr:hypothetical protein BC835DRAFT_1306986 [Cytidiella melzeri]